MSLEQDMLMLEGVDDIPELDDDVNSAGEKLGPMGKEDDVVDQAEEAFIAAMLLREFASPAELEELAESYDDMAEISDDMGIAMERTIVRLDRGARLRHLRKANTLTLARKANHAKFRKLMTIWKIERQLEGELDRIYGNKASQLARQQIKNYAANGIKKIKKAYPATAVGKGRVSSNIAQRAVAKTKKMFGTGTITNHKDDVAGKH